MLKDQIQYKSGEYGHLSLFDPDIEGSISSTKLYLKEYRKIVGNEHINSIAKQVAINVSKYIASDDFKLEKNAIEIRNKINQIAQYNFCTRISKNTINGLSRDEIISIYNGYIKSCILNKLNFNKTIFIKNILLNEEKLKYIKGNLGLETLSKLLYNGNNSIARTDVKKTALSIGFDFALLKWGNIFLLNSYNLTKGIIEIKKNFNIWTSGKPTKQTNRFNTLPMHLRGKLGCVAYAECRCNGNVDFAYKIVKLICAELGLNFERLYWLYCEDKNITRKNGIIAEERKKQDVISQKNERREITIMEKNVRDKVNDIYTNKKDREKIEIDKKNEQRKETEKGRARRVKGKKIINKTKKEKEWERKIKNSLKQDKIAQAIIEEKNRTAHIAEMGELKKLFPEKPIEILRTDMLTKTSNNSLLPKEELIDDSIAIYQDVLRLGDDLLKNSINIDKYIKILRSIKMKRRTMNKTEHQRIFFTCIRNLFIGISKGTFYPYNSQIISALMLINAENFYMGDLKGFYEQIPTGEGKSAIILMKAAYHASLGKRVFIATNNRPLAQRDNNTFKQLLKILGIKSDYYEYNSKKCQFPNAAITYVSMEDLGSGYLINSLTNPKSVNENMFDIIISDEGDTITIDELMNGCKVSYKMKDIIPSKNFPKILNFADKHEDLISNNIKDAVQMAKNHIAGIRYINDIVIGTYLRSAQTSGKLVKDEDYLIINNEIIPIDKENTGRIRHGTSWSDGITEFLYLRNGINLPEYQTGTLAQMAYPYLFNRLFDKVYCISGTFGNNLDRKKLKTFFGLDGFDIAPYKSSVRMDNPRTYIEKRKDHLDTIAKIANLGYKNGLPTLLINSSIKETNQVSENLKAKNLEHQVLTDMINLGKDGIEKPEEYLIGKAGDPRNITNGTNMIGRGSDIKISNETEKKGGLQTSLNSFAKNKRVEMQALGRSGRQGRNGITKTTVCLETDSTFNSFPKPVKGKLRLMITDSDVQESFNNDSKHLIPFKEENQKNLKIGLKERLLIDKIFDFARSSQNQLEYQKQCKMFDIDSKILKMQESLFDRIRNQAIVSKHNKPSQKFLHDTFTKWTSDFSKLSLLARNDDIFSDKNEPKQENINICSKKMKEIFYNTFGFQYGSLNSHIKGVAERKAIKEIFICYTDKLSKNIYEPDLENNNGLKQLEKFATKFKNAA